MTSNTNLRRRAPLLLLLLSACFCIAAACTGGAVRQNIELPAMRSAWDAIKVEATREANTQQSEPGLVAIGKADAAMTEGTAVAIGAAPWPTVDALALGDIQRRVEAGVIGPGVGDSLREELRLFALNRSKFARQP